MTRRRLILLALVGVLAIAAGVSLGPAIPARFRRAVGRRPGVIPEDRAGVPNWKVDEHFKKDVFTFVRIEYDSFGARRDWRRRPASEAVSAAMAVAGGAAGPPIFPTAT